MFHIILVKTEKQDQDNYVYIKLIVRHIIIMNMIKMKKFVKNFADYKQNHIT